MAEAGYKYLRSYQTSVVIYDLTVQFCNRWINKSSRTHDQMVQAARSGKQNIAEGYLEKSLKSHIKLAGVAYASQGELIEDFEDFLRQRNLAIWNKDDPRIKKFREFRVFGEKTSPKLPENPEAAANFLLTFCHQAQFLLAKQIQALEEKFVKGGGYTENLFRRRLKEKTKDSL